MNENFWSPGMTLAQSEEKVIKAAMRFYNNHKPTTASALGIALRTLDNKLKKYAEEDAKKKEEQKKRQAERAKDMKLPVGVQQEVVGGEKESIIQKIQKGLKAR